MSANIHFYIRTDRPSKNGDVQICLMFILNRRQRLKISTGKYVSLKKEYRKLPTEQLLPLIAEKKEELYCWDMSSERPVRGTENWQGISMFLDGEKTKANQAIIKLELMNEPLSIESFRNSYLKPNGSTNFKEYFLKELKERKQLMAEDTYKGYKATVNKVCAFKPGVSLSDINYKFLTGFENFMLKPIKQKGLGNIPSTVAKTMTMVRALVNIAIKNKHFLRDAYPFRDYKIKHVDCTLTTRDYLEPEGLLTVEQQLSPENIDNYNPQQIKGLKRFLFGCYTGLRFKDVQKLNWDEHVFTKWVFNPNNKTTSLRTYLSIIMNKTSKPVLIPLIDKALEIMGEKKQGLVFDKISNQKMNKHLKAINTKAGLNKKLSFHVSRHSFATICFLYGIPEKVGQQLLGHKNRKFTEIYTHLSSNRLFYEMDKFSKGMTEYALVIEEADTAQASLKEMLPMLQTLSYEKLEHVKGMIKLIGK